MVRPGGPRAPRDGLGARLAWRAALLITAVAVAVLAPWPIALVTIVLLGVVHWVLGYQRQLRSTLNWLQGIPPRADVPPPSRGTAKDEPFES